MQPLFIIPARGGSKGIPRKNIKPLAGKPLLAYTVEAAAEACRGDLSRIVLSTDDEEIAECGRSCGLTVDYMRPPHLGADTTSSRDVILDVMDWVDSRHIFDYDCVVLLQPTSPFRTGADILATIGLLASDPGADMAVSVCESASNPYYNIFETAPDGSLHISKGDGLFTRRQDVPKVWEYNGAVYAMRPDSVRRMQLGEFPRRIPYEMPRSRSIDLDTMSDWIVAETILNNR